MRYSRAALCWFSCLNCRSICWCLLIVVFSRRSILPTCAEFRGLPDSGFCLMPFIRCTSPRYELMISELRFSRSRLLWEFEEFSLAAYFCIEVKRSSLPSISSIARSIDLTSFRMSPCGRPPFMLLISITHQIQLLLALKPKKLYRSLGRRLVLSRYNSYPPAPQVSAVHRDCRHIRRNLREDHIDSVDRRDFAAGLGRDSFRTVPQVSSISNTRRPLANAQFYFASSQHQSTGPENHVIRVHSLRSCLHVSKAFRPKLYQWLATRNGVETTLIPLWEFGRSMVVEMRSRRRDSK